jgi:hypothetical protein
LELWQQGLVNGVFKPQLHGREHVHALAWLHELQAGNRQLTDAFQHGVWGIPYVAKSKQRRSNLLAALDIYGMQGEEAFQTQWIKDSARIFKEKFGYASDTFIPPTYIWHNRSLPAIKDAGISGIQGLPLQYEPVNGINSKYRKKLHITGTKSSNGITKIARNAFFEPASKPQLDWVDTTLSAIKKAFDKREAAVIGSHRINYIGSLDKTNRDNNLKSLGILLVSIVDKWPDVEFLTSDVLLKYILDSQ